MSAPLPPDEVERLRLLRSLDILDTAPEPVFDRITRLVAKTLDVPMALVTLIDEDRQWFKSKVGIDGTETPREHAFCAHAILGSQPMIVPDATNDDRFRDNPYVTSGPNVRFYAGIPLRSSGGLALGTLCAVDNKPRQITDEQLDILRDLAEVISKEVHLRETLMLARSQLKHSQEVLDSSEARFRAIFELASVGIAMVAPDGGWISVNDALCGIVGYTADELKRLTFKDITHPDDLDLDLDLLKQLKDGKITQYQMEKRYFRKDRSNIWVALNVTKKVNEAGDLEYFVAVVRNIQARKEAQESLATLHRDLEKRVEERTAELNAVIENANDAYISTDADGIVTAWNRHATLAFGWTAAEAIGRRIEELIIPPELGQQHPFNARRHIDADLAAVMDQRVELPARRKDGSTLMVEIQNSIIDVRGRKIFSAFLHDITERKEKEARRDWEARHDALTGLLNRRGLNELLPVAQSRADRGAKPLALLFIDLDGFKGVNDKFGHEAGDAVLIETANRLKEAIRQTDTAIRLAGDEFTILLERVESLDEARRVALKLLPRIATSIAVTGGEAHVGASIGIALYQPGSALAAEALIAEADSWMYRAKRAGKGRVLPE